jgi:uncharacterized protein (DUF58 family)
MWFYPLLLALVILAIAGGTLMGGVYTIVLIPIAAIVLISAIVYALWGRALQGSHGVSTDAEPVSERPLPHSASSDGSQLATPGELVDARRRAQ